MASRRKTSADDEPLKPRRPPATTPEAREQQMIAAAFDLAEKQILEGTASSQVLSLFLKAGSSREKLEKERLERENELLEVKKATMESAQRVEQMYGEAMKAFARYSGNPDPEDEVFDD